jgi:hypothetical protein
MLCRWLHQSQGVSSNSASISTPVPADYADVVYFLMRTLCALHAIARC